MFFVADAIGFEGMNAQKRAEYLHSTFHSGIQTNSGHEATGVDILWTLTSLDIPLTTDGFIDSGALLGHVIRELGGPEPAKRKKPDQVEAVVNVLLAVDMLELKRGDKLGYVPSTDPSMFRAVLIELGKIGYETMQGDTSQNLW